MIDSCSAISSIRSRYEMIFPEAGVAGMPAADGSTYIGPGNAGDAPTASSKRTSEQAVDEAEGNRD
jgi:hypothetical protein